MMTVKKVGLRTLKTALAVSVTLIVSDFIPVTNPFFAAIAAIIAMEPSVSAALETGKDRMWGTILGAVMALLLSLFAPVNALTIGIGVIIVIYISNLFEWQGTIKISSIVFLAILLGYEDAHQIDYAMFRTLDTFIGLTVGTLVNFFIFPHDVGGKVIRSMEEIIHHLIEEVEQIEGHQTKIDLSLLKKDLDAMGEQLDALEKDVKLHVHTQHDNRELRRILNRFERVYHHLAIIDAIDAERDAALGDVDQLVQYHNRRILTILEEVYALKRSLEDPT